MNITTILMINLLCVLIGKILLDLTLTKLPADFLLRMNKITPSDFNLYEYV